ncbi:regucalcin-like isoform X2 [Varroa destructor]|nr:regucalcin-like isoform X2 [Varroa destructor]
MFPLFKRSKLPSEFVLQSSVLISDGLQIRVVDLDNNAELDVCSLEDIGLKGTVGAATTHNSGRLFFSVIQSENNRVMEQCGGTFCCMTTAGSIFKLYDGICLSDGMCFNKDYSRLFAFDLMRKRLVYFSLDQINITSPSTFINWETSPLVENSQVRGMAVDKNDHLWVCCSGEGKVIEVDIESKTILRDLLMPKAKELSSVCFGGTDYRELFVASSYVGLTQDELTRQVNAGHIFAVKGYSNLQGRKPTPILLNLNGGKSNKSAGTSMKYS